MMWAALWRRSMRFGAGGLLFTAASMLAQSAVDCSGPVQTVIGRVTDTQQAALPNAELVASCGTHTHTVQTDAEGAYRLQLEPGAWSVLVKSAGFTPATNTLHVQPGMREVADVQLAVAQENQNITVTAEVGLLATSAESASKSDTPILQQPFAIQTVTLQQLQQQNVQSLNQALKYTAGATPEMYGPDPRGDWFLIRGNPADVYLDGIRVPQAVNSPNSFAAVQVDFNDVSRVEILEGPSSTLYGQSNIGGIVDAVSKQPTTLPHRSVQIQGGNFDRLQGGGDFSGPLNRSASLLYSINGIARTSHTYVYGAKDDRFTLNPTLQWNITPKFSANVFGKYFHGDAGTAAVFLPRSGTLYANPSLGYLPTWFNTGDPATDRYRKRQYMTGYGLEYRSNKLYLKHTTRYVHGNILYQGVYSAAAFLDAAQTQLARVNFLSKPVLNALQSDVHARTHVQTGKIRHTLIGGSDFQWQKYLNRQGGVVDLTQTLNLRNPVYGTPKTTPTITTATNAEQFQGGLYGQDELILGGWTVALGGRYDQTAQETITFGTNGSLTSVGQRPHAFTGHAGISYHMHGLAPYASYSTSFLPTVGQDWQGRPFVPTRGSSYEGGLKYQLPQHLGMVTFSAFSMTQDNRTTTDPDHPLFQRQTGQVRTIGEELQANFIVIRSLDVSFNYTHVNPVVTRSDGSTPGSTGVDYHKMLSPLAKDSLGLWTHYTVRRTLMTGFGFGGGYRYQGPKWGDQANTFQTPGYSLFDGTLDYTMERWRFAINSSNLLNKRYVAACSTTTNCYYGGTRSAIASVNFSF
ncbi:TonB-dependent siderophore receptor [Terriglobus tenax]|uniref:TonB-dependent siderophore receptor n=1 Tax=Terriglobus tenax TaxID=1111115 RepID=UPI0021DF8EA6|nr:TonB-dependent siderophore receptor [Terriglobus tenax]